MSYGVVMCGKCKREIHQDGPEHTWRHCEDKTLICEGASKPYANPNEAVGKYCRRDAAD